MITRPRPPVSVFPATDTLISVQGTTTEFDHAMHQIHRIIMDDLVCEQTDMPYTRFTLQQTSKSFAVDRLLPDTVKSNLFLKIMDGFAKDISETRNVMQSFPSVAESLNATDSAKRGTLGFHIRVETCLPLNALSKTQAADLIHATETVLGRRAITTTKLLSLGYINLSVPLISQAAFRPELDAKHAIRRLELLHRHVLVAA